MKALNTLINIISWLFILVIVILALDTIASNTTILGRYRSYVVQSGSMEPTIMTGDIIIIHSLPNYQERDVITFKTENERIVTHRIVGIKKEGGEKIFITKGDANRSEDEGKTTYKDILGKVVFVVPKLGYFVAFSKTLPGIFVLIILPGGLIAISELLKMIKNE